MPHASHIVRLSVLLSFAVGLAGCMGSTESVTVAAGKTEVIGGSYSYDPRTCTTGQLPIANIERAPRNGTVSIRKQSNLQGPDARCAGLVATGTIYVYTPRPGFRGKDQVAIREKLLLGISGGVNQDVLRVYDIEVR
jgi:hypothetical protein